jgi:hypothetical protein
MTLDFPGHQVPCHNAPRSAIDEDNVEELPSNMHYHCTCRYLLFQSLISP